PHGDFLTRPFGSRQFLDCAFGEVPAWIFPNLLVDNYLIDCIVLASFAHSHALVTELSTSFGLRAAILRKSPPPWTLATTTPLILTTRCRHYECKKTSSRRQFFQFMTQPAELAGGCLNVHGLMRFRSVFGAKPMVGKKC